jgi:hypothetical protein
MEIVWAIIGITIPALIGIGLALMAMPNATPTEFLAARVCFCLSSLILLASTLSWELRTQYPFSSRVIVGCLVGALIFVLFPISMQWLDTRQNQPKDLASSKSTPVTANPVAQKSIPAVSPPTAAMAVPGEIGWNFISFLGMSSGSPTGAPDPQFIVQTFQAFGRNTWSSTITKIEGYVEIDGTGERFPLFLSKDGTSVDLAQMPPIENDERIEVVCYFTQDRSLWGSWQGGIETNSFLNRYTPFTFVVSINGGKERKYPFSTEDCRTLIQSYKDGVLRHRN